MSYIDMLLHQWLPCGTGVARPRLTWVGHSRSDRRLERVTRSRFKMAAVRRLITSVTRNGQLRLLAKAALPSLSTARSYCSEKPPGRYPVPDMTSLPADIQERIDEVQEKVRTKSLVYRELPDPVSIFVLSLLVYLLFSYFTYFLSEILRACLIADLFCRFVPVLCR